MEVVTACFPRRQDEIGNVLETTKEPKGDAKTLCLIQISMGAGL